MDLKDLDGVYSLTIKTNAGGAYSEKPITGNICIENGKIRGADELNVTWCGFVECPEGDHIKYHITIDPKKSEEMIVTRKADGEMTDSHRDFIGTFKVSRKNDTEILLSSLENMSSDDLAGEHKALVSLKRVETNTDCALCKE